MEQASGFRRFRRLRQTPGLRNMVRETRLSVDDFVYPLFVTHGVNVRAEVPSMPDVYQLSVDQLRGEIDELRELGIGSTILFGIPEHKDPAGTDAYNPDGIIQRAIRAIKAHDPDFVVIGDVCLCEYTDHGHCGLLDGEHILADICLAGGDAGNARLCVWFAGLVHCRCQSWGMMMRLWSAVSRTSAERRGNSFPGRSLK